MDKKFNHLFMVLVSLRHYMKVLIKKVNLALTDQHMVMVVVLKVGLHGYHQNIKVTLESMLVLVEKLLGKIQILNHHHIIKLNQQTKHIQKVQSLMIHKD